MRDGKAERLYLSNVGLVDAVAHTRYRKMLRDPDLLQSGKLGLWKAALGWASRGKGSFRAYAYTCIKNEMEAYRKTIEKWEPPVEDRDSDGAIDDGPMYDVMSAVRARYKPEAKERIVLTALIGGATKAEIASRMGVSPWRVREIAKKAYAEIAKENKEN